MGFEGELVAGGVGGREFLCGFEGMGPSVEGM